MIFIVDASVAAKWVLPEPGSSDATALRRLDNDLIAPTFVIAEIGNALWKATLRGDIGSTDAEQAQNIIASHFTNLVPLEELAGEAFRHAISLRHPIYDCFYLALAARERGTLVTADERLFAAARKAKVKARLL